MNRPAPTQPESPDFPDDLAEQSGIRNGLSHSLDIEVDLDRGKRCGFPEAVFGEGKTSQQLLTIATVQLEKNIPVFVTRISDANAQVLVEHFDQPPLQVHYNSVAKTVLIEPSAEKPAVLVGYVPVLSAGTTDLPVVEEALETLQWMKVKSKRIMDVGVAGPHRLVNRVDELKDADAVVVVAGMEGALPSVVAGHVNCPVVAVPTSVGYGANLEGVAALLSMLNSCAANVSVVNIDAGFKGAYVAGLIAARAQRKNDGT
ncbi:MAG: nickel pincer cofactor biosynthesis protein LarB [Planctomycetota bacterium]|nr:nickel pincer cofactor biosynthesis protein LarB [Planctomycetota bacterium]